MDTRFILLGLAVVAVGVVAVWRLVGARTPTPASAPKGAIESADAARRLARAIAADIALYNADACDEARRGHARSAPLVAALDEGRALFAARVAPSLHRHYDEAIDDMLRARR